MTRELRFMLTLPMDVEGLLEALLSDATMRLPLGDRTKAAGDCLAGLVRAEAKRLGVTPRVKVEKREVLVDAEPPEPAPKKKRRTSVEIDAEKLSERETLSDDDWDDEPPPRPVTKKKSIPRETL